MVYLREVISVTQLMEMGCHQLALDVSSSVACAKLSHTAHGAGLIVSSSPSLYFPVHENNIMASRNTGLFHITLLFT